jgi:small subunit ribosomal protein S9
MIKTREQNIPQYVEAVGRRKTSVSRVRLFSARGGSASGGKSGKSGITVNGKDYMSYFPTPGLQKTVEAPLAEVERELSSKVRIEAKIKGGGISSQAGALRHGIARALQKFQPDLRKPLKKIGFLRRDSRMKERRKFGLKKARKAPQWSKR